MELAREYSVERTACHRADSPVGHTQGNAAHDASRHGGTRYRNFEATVVLLMIGLVRDAVTGLVSAGDTSPALQQTQAQDWSDGGRHPNLSICELVED